MEGTLEVRGTNAHPLENRPENRNDAFEFCSSGFRKHGLGFIKSLYVEEPNIEVVRHTEYTCDVIAKGSFENFPAVLAALFSDTEYEIRMTQTSLDVNLPPPNEEEESISGGISILHAGAVIDTNAEDFAKEKGYMAWPFDHISRYGMQFRLGLPKSSE